MRYLPIISGLGALVLTANTLAYVPQSFQVQMPQATAQATAFEEFIHRAYQENQELARRNNQYIADNIALREDMRAIVSDPEKAKQELVTRLGLVDHSYRYTTELPTTVFNLSPRQLVRVYLIMEALKTEKFKTDIGVIVEDDLKDMDSEHGGLVLFDGGNLTLHDIPSASKGDNNRYRLAGEFLNTPHIIPFHLHADSQDETESSGPSTIDMFFSSLEGYLDSGESHNIVVTKLKGRRFNIDFYGFEFKSDNLPKDTIINANDYEIMLDLGIYEY